MFCSRKSRAAALRLVAEAVRPRSSVPYRRSRVAATEFDAGNDMPAIHCVFGHQKHSVAAPRLVIFWGRLTEASRPRLQFFAPLRGSSFSSQLRRGGSAKPV